MRLLWMIMLLTAAAAFMLISVSTLYGLYLVREDGPIFVIRLPSTLFWFGIFVLAAGACARAAFMRPGALRELAKEEPSQRAAWLDQLNTTPKDPADRGQAGERK